MTSIRLPEKLEQRLVLLAQATKRNKSFFIREALEHYLDDLEDAYIAMERIAKPHRVMHSTQEVLKRLDDKSPH